MAQGSVAQDLGRTLGQPAPHHGLQMPPTRKQIAQLAPLAIPAPEGYPLVPDVGAYLLTLGIFAQALLAHPIQRRTDPGKAVVGEAVGIYVGRHSHQMGGELSPGMGQMVPQHGLGQGAVLAAHQSLVEGIPQVAGQEVERHPHLALAALAEVLPLQHPVGGLHRHHHGPAGVALHHVLHRVVHVLRGIGDHPRRLPVQAGQACQHIDPIVVHVYPHTLPPRHRQEAVAPQPVPASPSAQH